MVSKKGLRAFFCFSRPPADEVLASRILVPPSLWPVDTGARSHAPATIRGKRPSSGKRAQFGIKSVSMRLTRSSQSHPARNVLYARYLQNLWITSDGTTGKRHPGCSWVECLNFELCLAATLHELAEFVRGQSAPNVATVKAGIELLSLLQWHRTGECHEPEAVWVKAGRRAVIRRRQQTTLNRITAWHTGHLVMWNMMPEPGRNRVCVRGQPYRIAVALGLQRGIDQESSHRPPCLPCPPQRNQAS